MKAPSARSATAVVVTACVALGGATALGVRLVNPTPAEPVSSPGGAVVVLGGGGNTWPARLQAGGDILAESAATKLWVSDPYGPNAVADPTGKYYTCADAATLVDNRGLDDVEVLCFVPDPATTRGEAQAVAALAAAESVDPITVVTFTPHVERTRYIFAHCGLAEVTVVAHSARLAWWQWVSEAVYQSGGFLKAIAQGSCETTHKLPAISN